MERKNYYIFALVEAINCNPNGDPSDDNMPRLSPDNGDFKLKISNVSIKRKMRNAWSDMGLKVILDNKYKTKTIPQAYKESLGGVFNKDGDLELGEVDLESKRQEFIDIVFGIYNDGRIKGISHETFETIKKQQLVISEATSVNNVGHKIQSFRDGITSHFISKEGKEGGGMGDFKQIDYALFPIIMNASCEYSNDIQEKILKGLVNGFNHNQTSSKNFNVIGGGILETNLPVKHNFINAENPLIDGYRKLKLEVSNNAKNFNVKSGFMYLPNGNYVRLEKETILKEILSKYVEYFNNK